MAKDRNGAYAFALKPKLLSLPLGIRRQLIEVRFSVVATACAITRTGCTVWNVLRLCGEDQSGRDRYKHDHRPIFHLSPIQHECGDTHLPYYQF